MYGLVLGLAALAGSPLPGQGAPPQLQYSTHDQTLPVGGEGGDFREWAVDAKSPGDGRTYTVSTITVKQAGQGSVYSNFVTNQVGGLNGFNLSLPNQRQITVLQITDGAHATAPYGIVAQSFFYGETGLTQPEFSRATNARGLSVWPTGNPLTTRVATCGETFDQRLPLSQAPSGWPAWTGQASSGYIAVFDGDANLQWTYHLYGAAGDQHSIVTDVSIRVVPVFEGTVLRDTVEIVTYCGLTTQGNPTANGSMSVVAPYDPPTGIAGCTSPAGGNTDNGAGQWDGFVGRIVRSSATGAITTQFHAVVGGAQQDGLFGLAEIDENRFVVIGSTGTSGTVGTGGRTFPFLSLPNGVCLGGAAVNYAMGVAMVFDASTVSGSAPKLTLESTQHYGAVTGAGGGGAVLAATQTVLRDVLVQPSYLSGLPHMVVVGSTNDPEMFGPLGITAPGPQATYGGGGSDGLIVTSWLPGGSAQLPVAGTYRGGEGMEFLTGVSGWSEFTDQFVVVGAVQGGSDPSQIDVGNYYINTSAGHLSGPLVSMQNVLLGGSGSDYPTAIGAANGTGSFATYGLGDPAGGGIAVDDEARTNVVGTTFSSNYPVLGPGARAKTGALNDAVRSVLHMLPANSGRTDGTYAGIGAPPVSLPVAGFYGGTTPQCALSAFGAQAGMPAPELPRMQIDLEVPLGGAPTAGNPVAVVVSRPPGTSPAQVSAWQLDFPTSGPGPYQFPEGLVYWIMNGAVYVPHLNANPLQNETVRYQWTLPPNTSATVSVQLICGLLTPVTGGLITNCTPALSTVAGSPALWFQY